MVNSLNVVEKTNEELITELELKKTEAIASENFEEAARIRDEINKLKTKETPKETEVDMSKKVEEISKKTEIHNKEMDIAKIEANKEKNTEIEDLTAKLNDGRPTTVEQAMKKTLDIANSLNGWEEKLKFLYTISTDTNDTIYTKTQGDIDTALVGLISQIGQNSDEWFEEMRKKIDSRGGDNGLNRYTNIPRNIRIKANEKVRDQIIKALCENENFLKAAQQFIAKTEKDPHPYPSDKANNFKKLIEKNIGKPLDKNNTEGVEENASNNKNTKETIGELEKQKKEGANYADDIITNNKFLTPNTYVDLLQGEFDSLILKNKSKEFIQGFLTYNMLCVSQMLLMMGGAKKDYGTYGNALDIILSEFNTIIKKSQELGLIDNNTEESEMFNKSMIYLRSDYEIGDYQMNKIAQTIGEVNAHRIKEKIRKHFGERVMREIERKTGISFR